MENRKTLEPLQPTQNGAVISDTNPDRYKRPPHHHCLCGNISLQPISMGVSPLQMEVFTEANGAFTEANGGVYRGKWGVSPLQMVRLQPRTEQFLHRQFPETKQLLKKNLLKIGQNLSQNHASHLPSINFQLCWLNLVQLQGKLTTSTASQWMLWKLKTRSLQNKRKYFFCTPSALNIPTVNQGFGNPQLYIYIYTIYLDLLVRCLEKF